MYSNLNLSLFPGTKHFILNTFGSNRKNLKYLWTLSSEIGQYMLKNFKYNNNFQSFCSREIALQFALFTADRLQNSRFMRLRTTLSLSFLIESGGKD